MGFDEALDKHEAGTLPSRDAQSEVELLKEVVQGKAR